MRQGTTSSKHFCPTWPVAYLGPRAFVPTAASPVGSRHHRARYREKFAAAYQSYFEKHAGNAWLPSSLVLDVQQLSEDVLVEIDSVAYLGRR